MEKTEALQNLLNGTASEEDINLLRQLLTRGEISIGGNVNHSVIIFGSGNTVELPPVALGLLNARSLLGDLERDLTGEEIAWGLKCLEDELPLRAPILLVQFQELSRRLKLSLKTNSKALSDQVRNERTEAMAHLNSLCIEALDISFNALCLGETPPDYDSRSPFRGLESFRPEDSEFFFGREVLTEKLVGRIKSHSFLAVLGASGSGKSSLVMAGLIPTLGLDYAIFRPGANPLAELESVKGKQLIIVDQFEELFTLTQDKVARKAFISQLLESTKRSKVIITLRSDFLGEVAGFHDLNDEVQAHLENVPPMNIDELRQAMEGQANVVGLRFEADLSQQVLDDVEGEPGAMPLLQHALWELWNRRHGRNLRAREYRAFGGVRQAISSTAEKIYGECNKWEQEQIRDIFLRLTRLDDSDERRDTRKRVALGDLISFGRDFASTTLLFDKLASARLIVKTINEEKTEIEVAHESLIRYWDRLHSWLNEDRELLHLRQGISEAAQEWEISGRDENLLIYHGGRLEDALRLREKLSSQEQAYVMACNSAVQRRRKNYVIWVSSGVFVVAAILFAWGLSSSNNAERLKSQVSLARANELAARALVVSQEFYDVGLLLAVEAYNLENNSFTRSTLSNVLQSRPEIYQYIRVNNTHPSVVINPANFLATGSCAEPKVHIWDMGIPDNPENIMSFDLEEGACITDIKSGLGGFIMAVLYTVDAEYKIVVMIVFPPDTVEMSVPINVLDIESPRIALSENGSRLIAVDYRNTKGTNVLVWDTKKLPKPFELHLTHVQELVFDIALDPSGNFAALKVYPDDIMIWELSDPANPTVLQALSLSNFVYTAPIIYSPSGSLLATSDNDTYDIHIYRVSESGMISEVHVLEGNNAPVTTIAFSPDENQLAAGNENEVIYVWDLNKPNNNPRELVGHSEDVTDLAFSWLEESMLVSAGSDGAIIVWNLDQDNRSSPLLKGRLKNGEPIHDLEFSESQGILAGINAEGSVLFWDMGSPENTESIAWISGRNTSQFYFHAIDFSPDGKLLAATSDKNIVSFWDVSDIDQPTLAGEITDFDSYVGNLEFSPDSEFIAIRTADDTHYLWDVVNPKTPLLLSTIPSTRTNATWWSGILSFDPNSNRLIISSDWMMSLVDIRNPKSPTIMASKFGYGNIAQFHPNQPIIAISDYDGNITFWDVSQEPRELLTTKEHAQLPYGLSFNEFGTLLVSGGHDSKIIVWDTTIIEDTRPYINIVGGDYQITDVIFIGDFHLAVSDDDGGVYIYSIDPQYLIERACIMTMRNFTREEWERYLPWGEYRATCSQWTLEP